MRFHWLRLRATAHPTEDVERVAAALRFVSGLNEDAFEDAVQASDIESHHGGTVTLIEVELRRNRAIRDTVARLLDPDLAPELERRVDDDGTFYVRFDKQAAFRGQIRRTTGEDAVQTQWRIEVHPAGRQRAIAAWQDLFAA